MAFWQPRKFDDPEVETEFQVVYQTPGLQHLGYACAIGGITTLLFYFIDRVFADQPWSGGPQTLRLLLIVAFLSVTLMCFRAQQRVTFFYKPLFALTATALVPLGCWISFSRHRGESVLQLLWSLDMTLILSIMVLFGFSRLTVASTALLGSSSAVATLAGLAAWQIVGGYHLTRIAAHLMMVVICAAWLRHGIETRERSLFMFAKEAVRRDRAAAALEIAKRAAEEADAAKARFLANMSHEIRKPMNGVLQTLDVVGQHVSDADRALIEKARAAGQALLRILNSILDHAKTAHGASQLRQDTVEIADVCRTVVALHTAAAHAKGIGFQSQLDLPPGGQSHVRIDEVRLFEIVNNLVANALKFTDAGLVDLAVRLSSHPTRARPAGELEIRVRDTGPGIPPAEQEHIFLPFFQRGSARSRAAGTGLGLSIVKQLVELLGGRINVQSAPGAGSTFTVILPVELVLAETGTSTAHSLRKQSGGQRTDRTTASPQGAGKRVLLADDNDLNADLAATLLRAIGLSVTVAADGQEAVDAFRATRFDVVLMDCQMPVLDGYEATRRIRVVEAEEGRLRTPIVALTAFTLEGEREKCLAAGMDDYLGKPYSLRELRPKLSYWLKARI